MSRLLRAFMNPATVAMEADIADGKGSKEIEYMYYAKCTNLHALKQAVCVEIQQQWGLWTDKSENNAGSGSNRVRKTITKQIVDGSVREETAETSYVMTTKIKTQEGDAIEVPNPSSEAGLKAYQILAESGMIKHRYRFPVMGSALVWEVDMFVVPGESMYATVYEEWCKLDLEVPDRTVVIPPLPEGFVEGFDSKGANLTDEQKVLVDEMKKFLSLPNPHITDFYKDVLT